MKYMEYLLAVNLIFWVTIFGYILNLMKKNNALTAEVMLLKEGLQKKGNSSHEK